ncbi:MAG: hypothetical protein GTO67_14800 [Gammaproteobacteria bacterium]|nr:hypothetical protein [Gammaproteobacteria bacterium]NIT17557.1 hypothetical protein [Gammaproteobacteria bacterium]
MSAYSKLEAKAREIARLREVAAITHWDEACMMPRGGGTGRSEALASLATLIHERVADPEIGELLNRARGEGIELDAWQSANVTNMEREFVEATAIPSDLVRASRLAELKCEQAWREARARNDWATVEPLLAHVVGLARQQADALADAMHLSRYDALLEVYEPELRVADIEPVFEDLKAFLPGALETALDRQGEVAPLEGPFTVEEQRQLSVEVMGLLGFDFERGRLDVSHHPFCGGVPDDTRITTRYLESSFIEALMATCHETGHALYQQGLPRDWRQQPVGDSLGAAVHESQSLLMELQVCRSDANSSAF